MINLNDETIQAEYRKVRLEEARRHSLIQEALGYPNRRTPLSHRFMARLGDLFVALGRRLQSRYGEFWPQAEGSPAQPGMFAPNRLVAETPANSPPGP
jgi:hypothetical protein